MEFLGHFKTKAAIKRNIDFFRAFQIGGRAVCINALETFLHKLAPKAFALMFLAHSDDV